MITNKLDELKKLKNDLIKVNGLENIDNKIPSIIISNHNCLMDIFYLPLVLNNEIVSLISPRLIYKKIENRQETVNKYLYAMPIEAHGGKTYSNICINKATELLNNNISLNIFPEGAYINDQTTVYRGRTGATRILFNAVKQGTKANIIPAAINIKNITDLDCYEFNEKEVEITILPPIEYESAFNKFSNTEDTNIKNEALHQVTDEGMKAIAQALNRLYKNEYIELYKKGNVIFEDGKTINIEDAQNQIYINKYNNELTNRQKIITKQIKKII